MARKPTILIVLDGWGQAPDGYPHEYNAIAQAKIPTYRALLEKYPHTLIRTSGEDVGLPDGVMGNSEVGHMNMGAGRIIWQELVRIDKQAREDDFRSITAIMDAVQHTKNTPGSRLHLMGLCSDGSVHSVDRHYFAILRLARQAGLTGDQVVMHCFTDGRDTPPHEGVKHIRRIHEWMKENGTGVIATVCGRYYAMDRDTRWDRTQLAYDAMVLGAGLEVSDPVAAVEQAYATGQTDEFIKPCVIVRDGQPVATIRDHDWVINFNYRADRVRQISHALTDPEFRDFERRPIDVHLVTMTKYKDGLRADIAFPQQSVRNSIGELFGKLGKTQLRIAETEKYPHVSFFFSGGTETPFPGEQRLLIPSPREVATYDMKPEMSAPEIADAVVRQIQDPNFDLIVNNYANADMVGHTGNIAATIRACEHVDAALTKVLAQVRASGGTAIITADHGNAEQLWDFEANSPQTQHTTNPVPLIIMDEDLRGTQLRQGGRLCDIAPTILHLLNLEKPGEMDGLSLVN
ncbi:MAG: 2,3-bisphosphoglycerate-independent phosphoglycerate mutase [Candidatus Sumerlaeaceae bacterium]